MTLRGRGADQDQRYRLIWPPRLVWYLEDDRWLKAQLEGMKETHHGWSALIRINPPIHHPVRQPRWVSASQIRVRASMDD